MLRSFAVACLTVLALALAACSKPTFNSVDITGAEHARDFALTDHTGARRTIADYRGKVVAVFFGFTQCPDVCPTALADLAQVRKALGADADKLQVIFISLDPERDTREVLAQYVPGFDPSFVGLAGSLEDTTRTAREFKVFFAKSPGKTPTSYSIDHTAGIYLFDKTGRVRLFARHSQGVESLAADIKQLM